MIKLYFKIVNMLKIGGHMTTTTFVSKESKVLTALQNETRTYLKANCPRSKCRKPQAVIQR